jgi:hypothetical protein
MTNTQLKAQIDSEITNESQIGGITQVDVGNNLKKIVDYVDQQTINSLPYNFWRAIINTNPPSVNEVLHDGLSFTSPIITNPSNGNIVITKAGLDLPLTKLDLLVSNINNAGQPYMTTVELDSFSAFPNDAIKIKIWDMAGGQTSTPNTKFTVEIRIYN